MGASVIFCIAVRCGSRCEWSNSMPATETLPESIFSNWFRQRKNVLFPQPLGPIITTVSPRCWLMEMPRNTACRPKDFFNCSTAIMMKFPFQVPGDERHRITQTEIDRRRHQAEAHKIVGRQREHPIDLRQLNHGNDRHER